MRTAILLAVLCVSSVALAGEVKTPIQGTTEGTKPVSSSDDGKVCERKKILGSHRSEIVCTTADERSAAKTKAQNDLDRLGRCSGNDTVCSSSITPR